jgi:hypothetical protein
MGVLMHARPLFPLGSSLIALALLAGCFNAPKPNCAFLCGEGNACPDEYQCSTADNRCHLLLDNGDLAVCEDPLPVDGSVVDGPVIIDGGLPDAPADARLPDAKVPDSSVPDAMNVAPVLGAITTPRNVVAGTTVTITPTATDANTSQTLTFTAVYAGTNENPFAVSPRGAPDTAGGSFANGTFTMDTGVLGTFDVTFGVSDGNGGSDSQLVRIVVAASPIHINELQIGTTALTRNLELVNEGTGAVDISGWELVAGGTSVAVPAGVSLAGGDFYVFHATTGVDDAHNQFGVTLLDTAVATTQEVALFDGTNHEISRDMRDFVKWGTGAGRVDQAIFANQWPSTSPSDFVSTSGLNADLESLSRTPGAGSESKADWYVETVPTLGAANTP